MQLHLDGSISINAPKSKVFSLLSDPNFLAKTLPDAEDVRVIDSDTLEARLKLRVAVVSSTLKVKMTVSERDPPNKATLRADGQGSGSAMKIVSVFTLEGDSPTKMGWTADAEVTGVMAGLGSSLLKGFAAKKVAEIFGAITRALEAASR